MISDLEVSLSDSDVACAYDEDTPSQSLKSAPVLGERIKTEPSIDTAQLRISEVFYSLQGETDRAGLPTVFVRLTGCPLRCRWCDTSYAFQGGQVLPLVRVLEKIADYPTQRVCVTGGEPLAQPESILLMRVLCDAGYDVSLETSGTLNIAPVDARVMKVMDLKAPDSGEVHRNRWENVLHLTQRDVVKFVIASRLDFEWAVNMVREYALEKRLKEVLFSPAFGIIEPSKLAEWVLECGLDVRFQLQLHKILWGDRQGV